MPRSFAVQYSVDGGRWTMGVEDTFSDARGAHIISLSPEHMYSFRVAAHSIAALGPYSDASEPIRGSAMRPDEPFLEASTSANGNQTPSSTSSPLQPSPRAATAVATLAMAPANLAGSNVAAPAVTAHLAVPAMSAAVSSIDSGVAPPVVPAPAVAAPAVAIPGDPAAPAIASITTPDANVPCGGSEHHEHLHQMGCDIADYLMMGCDIADHLMMSEEEALTIAATEGLTLVKDPSNKSTYKSVYKSGSGSTPYRYVANRIGRIGSNGRYIGTFDSPHEAALAVARSLGPQGSAELASNPRNRGGWTAQAEGMTAEQAREAAKGEGLTLAPSVDCRTGYAGVYDARRNKASSRGFFSAVDIQRGGHRVNKYLGSFSTAEEAALARARFLRDCPIPDEIVADAADVWGGPSYGPPGPPPAGGVPSYTTMAQRNRVSRRRRRRRRLDSDDDNDDDDDDDDNDDDSDDGGGSDRRRRRRCDRDRDSDSDDDDHDHNDHDDHDDHDDDLDDYDHDERGSSPDMSTTGAPAAVEVVIDGFKFVARPFQQR